MKYKVALIELNTYHEECLYPQIAYLKSKDIAVTLFCNKKLKKSILQSDIDVDVIHFIDKKIFSILFIYFKILRGNFKSIILNTAERKIYRLIKLPIPNRIKIYGLLHNANQLRTSSIQKKISRKIETYLVLSQNIKKNIIEEQLLPKSKISSFIPIYTINYTPVHIEKEKDDIWITVPGKIEIERRDYAFLNKIKTPPNVKFIILGRATGHDGLKWIESIKHNKSFITFDKFIPNDVMYTYLKKSDYILPLVHTNNSSFKDYLKYKITGSYNLAYNFKIPLLLTFELKENIDFKNCAIFYDSKNIDDFYNLLTYPPNNLYIENHWKSSFQQTEYLKTILS